MDQSHTPNPSTNYDALLSRLREMTDADLAALDFASPADLPAVPVAVIRACPDRSEPDDAQDGIG